jgi:hypothetical protein
VSNDPGNPQSHRADDSNVANERMQSEVRNALDGLTVEGRKLVVEMRRLLRAQCQKRDRLKSGTFSIADDRP